MFFLGPFSISQSEIWFGAEGFIGFKVTVKGLGFRASEIEDFHVVNQGSPKQPVELSSTDPTL